MLLARGRETSSPANSTRLWASLGGIVSLEVPLGPGSPWPQRLGLKRPSGATATRSASTDFFDILAVVATGGVSVVAYVR